MQLDDALRVIATHLHLSADALSAYAAEDDTGGFHTDAAKALWPGGSLWDGEGRTLYALVRALRPFKVLELGVHAGASTTHLRRAVQKNGYGYVRSVDKWEGAGWLIPPELKTVGELYYRDALAQVRAFAATPSAPIDFVFEDLCHAEREIIDLLAALRPKLAPGAVIVHHDSEHGDDGEKVRRGIEGAGITDYVSLLAGETDCGLAVYRV